MLVRDLINNLSYLDPDLIVVMPNDTNGFFPVREISDDNNMYDNGKIGLHHLTRNLERARYTKDDLRTIGKRCIVLWP